MKPILYNLVYVLVFAFLISCGEKDTPEPTKDVASPTVPAGLTGTATTTTVSLSWNPSTDNTGVTGYKVYRTGTGQVGTAGTTSFTDNGLAQGTQYSYTVSAYDAAGNNSNPSGSFTITTLINNSTWFAQPTITYASPVAGMIGNTVSNDIIIGLTNSSAVAKTAIFSLTFGANGSAVKMLRYQAANAADGTGWTVLPANAGTVTFSNFSMQPGTTTLRARFALKEVVGVANGSALSISFSSLNDGEGGVLPIGSAWQPAVNAGTVDADTQATKFTSEWLGYMSQSALTLGPNGTGTSSNYIVSNIKVSGPGNARVASLKLRNPYGNVLIWDNSSWKFVNTISYSINPSGINWFSDFVKINFPSEASISNSSFSSFFIGCTVQNASNTNTFNSGTTTPGLFGLELKTKYDIEVVNSAGQVIDLSDVVVKQGAGIVNN